MKKPLMPPFVGLLCAMVLSCAAGAQVTVTYDSSICDTFTGRVYVMLGQGRQEPRFGPAWFNPAPFFGLDVVDWKAATPLVIDDSAHGFPDIMSVTPDGEWILQAVLRRDLDSPSIGGGHGTGYSAQQTVRVSGGRGLRATVHIDRTVIRTPPRSSDRVRHIELRSDLLSDFHGRDVIMRAAVILPKGYDDAPARRYPTYYWVTGFGGSSRGADRFVPMWDATGHDDDMVWVVPDPQCYGGHHVFADSANNGPRGAALTEELIPHIESTFRVVSAPTARFLGGHSSGGWSSLWLQVTYPDSFGGTWSVAPDPVDFHDFQGIDLYADGASMYRDEKGRRRPLARQGEQVMIWYEDFARMEVPYGEGGQLRSFEWVFSPRGEDGLPMPLYDRETGAVNAEVARAWKRYDIGHVLEENWTDLGPKLEGKLNVIMGSIDTFYLDGASRRLDATLEGLGYTGAVEMIEGGDHGSVATPALRKRIFDQIMARFEAAHGGP